jgi:hypothetical protein
VTYSEDVLIHTVKDADGNEVLDAYRRYSLRKNRYLSRIAVIRAKPSPIKKTQQAEK